MVNFPIFSRCKKNMLPLHRINLPDYFSFLISGQVRFAFCDNDYLSPLITTLEIPQVAGWQIKISCKKIIMVSQQDIQPCFNGPVLECIIQYDGLRFGPVVQQLWYRFDPAFAHSYRYIREL